VKKERESDEDGLMINRPNYIDISKNGNGDTQMRVSESLTCLMGIRLIEGLIAFSKIK
jgi:hypothetical protein